VDVDVTILIATHGDGQWRDRGDACWRHHDQLGVPVVWHHEPDATVATVRNLCVDIADDAGVGQGWLCFVDADDFLEPGYLDAMAAADSNDADVLLAPAVRYGPGSDPIVFRDRHIRSMNPCVIGTLIHRDTFDLVGRFWQERAWEDWSLFRRAWLAGARIVHVPDAVYRANSTPDGRNSRVRHPDQLHAEIIHSHDRWLAQLRRETE
jgi:glycosyltransferase involved in cell wall biosynthesis